jgi:hypothetical protein
MSLSKTILAGSLILAALAAPLAHADEEGQATTSSLTHPVLEFGIARGGDKVLDAHFFFGGRESIHAGDAYYTDFGLEHEFADSGWGYKVTGGYAFATIGSFGSDRTFKRFPLDALATYSFGRQRIGFGATYHFQPQLDMNGHGADVRFHDAPGVILQYQYWMFGARYTYVRYRPKDLPGAPDLDGSSLGLFISIEFGKHD